MHKLAAISNSKILLVGAFALGSSATAFSQLATAQQQTQAEAQAALNAAKADLQTAIDRMDAAIKTMQSLLAECRELETAAAREECMKDPARAQAVEAASEASKIASKDGDNAIERMKAVRRAAGWQVAVSHEHVSGKGGLTASLEGIVREKGVERPATIGVTCRDNSTTFVIYVPDSHFGREALSVEYATDNGPVRRATWVAGRDATAVGLWYGQGIPFLTEIYGKHELRVTVQRSFAASLDFTFALSDTEARLKPLADACHWSPSSSQRSTSK